MAGLRDYKYVDVTTLDGYLEQFSTTEVELQSRSSKLGVSLTGPSADYTTTSRYRPKTTPEKIKELVEYLRLNNLLGRTRPKLMSDYERGLKKMPPFILEKTTARKVILPAHLLDSISGIKQLAVWISDPDPKIIVPEQTGYDFPGSFLYLTEMRLDNGAFQTTFSGCSALQSIANAAENRRLLDCTDTSGEPLGRDSYSHPAEKLVASGGVLGDIREIECLYRIRYMTNEQCFNRDGTEYRVNDILGYPIYIAEALGR
jgi:hypothetical protein